MSGITSTSLADGVDEEKDHAAFKARESVREEILAVIARYRHSDDKPPFSAAELIVMAVLCSTKFSLSKSEILLWVLKNFSSYGNSVWELYTSDPGMETTHSHVRFNRVIEGFCEVFSDWHVPLQDGNQEAIVSLWHCDSVTVPVLAGRIFLSKWLEPERRGTFSFLELPAELRNAIYEMVFSYPKTGLSVTALGYNDSSAFQLLERENDRLPEISKGLRHGFRGFQSLKLSQTKIFSLYFVCKQLYEESQPYFFDLNHISLDHYVDMLHFAFNSPSTRLEHLSDVRIDFNSLTSSVVKDFGPLVKSFDCVTRFRKLEIYTTDRAWFRMSPASREALGRKSQYKKLEQIPILVDLAALCSKADELIFSGECQQVEDFVRALIPKVKESGPVALKPKTRKRNFRQAVKDSEKSDNGGNAKKQKRT